MTRAQRSQLKEILLQVAELKVQLEAIHWKLGEEIPIEKSIKIGNAISSLKNTIQNLTGVI